jgi:S1-C subfamily serine protease
MAHKLIIQKHEEMFYPTVRVRTGKAGGSGTVVYSKKHNGEAHTYVLTNHHVIADNILVEKKWDPVLKKKVDTEILDTVQVEYFRYNNYSHCIGSFAIEADIIAYSEYEGGQDFALLRIRDKENTADWVAKTFPLTDIDSIHIFDKVFAVGASLGHPPIATEGHVSYMDDEIDHYNYWMSTAQTIFGNSGGAIYR